MENNIDEKNILNTKNYYKLTKIFVKLLVKFFIIK